MKKPGIYRYLIIAAMVATFAFLSGCGGNNEIEITVAPEKYFRGMVYIEGSVGSPGYYAVRDGDTFQSLLKAAGGTLPDADTSQVRLYVPAVNESYRPQKVDLNRADAWLIESLPGIGAVTAERIIQYRQSNGRFRSVDDLLRVEGVGETTLNKIRDLVTVSE